MRRPPRRLRRPALLVRPALPAPGVLPSLLLGLTGGALLGGRPRSRQAGALAAIAGLALLGVAAHRPASDALRRAGARRHGAELRFSVVLSRGVTDVFRFCSDFENFPRFVGALREVHDYGDGRSHWVAHSATGKTLEWDAVTTKYVPNRVLAWQSTAGSPLRTSGMLRFLPDRDGGTCVQVALAYQVMDMGLRDAVVAFALGSRARELEADIRRLAQHLELFMPRAEPAPPA